MTDNRRTCKINSVQVKRHLYTFLQMHPILSIICILHEHLISEMCFFVDTTRLMNTLLVLLWFNDVNDYLLNQSVPELFIGACCMIHREASINTNRKVDNNKRLIGRKFGGYLLLRDYGLLLKPSFDCVECHAFGNDEKGKDPKLQLSGAVHAVIGDE